MTSYYPTIESIKEHANLRDMKTSYSTQGFHLSCPEIGSFIAYKKVKGHIVTLLIPEDAKRSSATTLKCRASKAHVLSISGGQDVVRSDRGAVYAIHQDVLPDAWNDDRWNECSTGIHFFMNKKCAQSWDA